MADHYQVLEVPRTATQQEIRRAFRHQARRHHPDAGPPAGAIEPGAGGPTMAAVNLAWEILGDPASRRRYDAELGLPPGWVPVAGDSAEHRGPDPDGGHDYDYDEDDYGDGDYEEDPGPRRPADLLVMVPVVLVAVAVAAFVLSVVAQSVALATLSVLVVPVAVVGFVAAPLLSMTKRRSRR